MKPLLTLLSLIFVFAFFSCVTIAPPSPLLTYGGPKTTPHKSSETALAFGTSVALFEGAHSGAQGWFGRYKYGVGERWDVGADFVGAKRNEGLYISAKGATRYQLRDNLRFELGIGAADDSDGKSINGDVALTIGTLRSKPWNFYASLRGGFAKGYAGNAIFEDQTPLAEDTLRPPDTFIGLINFGAQGKVSDNQQFIFEGGYGYIFPKDIDPAPAFYISAGLLFTIGGL